MYHFDLFEFVEGCDTPFVTFAFVIFRDHGVNVTFGFSERQLWAFLRAVDNGATPSTPPLHPLYTPSTPPQHPLFPSVIQGWGPRATPLFKR
eukprot:381568-Prorocentrum_minimum.AAC.2